MIFKKDFDIYKMVWKYFLDYIQKFLGSVHYPYVSLEHIQEVYEERFFMPREITIPFRNWLEYQRPDSKIFYHSLIGNGAEFDKDTMLHEISSEIRHGVLVIKLKYTNPLVMNHIRYGYVIIFLVDDVPDNAAWFEQIYITKKKLHFKDPSSSNRGILNTYIFCRRAIEHSSNIEYAARELGIFVREWSKWEHGINTGNKEILPYRNF